MHPNLIIIYNVYNTLTLYQKIRLIRCLKISSEFPSILKYPFELDNVYLFLSQKLQRMIL